MQFQDELAGGIVLIRPALQSPDYVAGASGWSIKVDGSAEFNNITIRGSGTADPLVVGPAGMPQVIVRTTPTNGLVVFPTNRPIEQDAATLNSAVVDQGAANERAELQMNGPTVTGATGGVRVVLRSQPQDGSLPAEFSVQSRAGSPFFVVDETEVRVVERRIDSRQLAATSNVIGGYVAGDTSYRVRILASGEIRWGPGGAGPEDVRLYRDAANVLATDDILRVYRTLTTDNAFSVRLSGDTSSRVFVNGDGGHHWGPGTGGSDVSLTRSAAGVLTVAGSLEVTGTVTSAAMQSGTVVITPTVADQWTANVPVTFTTPFASAPAVVLTCTVNGPGVGTTTELEWCATSVTASGFNARIRRGNLTATTLTWVAVIT